MYIPFVEHGGTAVVLGGFFRYVTAAIDLFSTFGQF